VSGVAIAPLSTLVLPLRPAPFSTLFPYTTLFRSLLALSIIQKTETEDSFYMHKDAEEKILKVVFNSASEIQTELKNIFNKVIEKDRKSTRLNSSHVKSSYAGFCLKKTQKTARLPF